MVPEHALLGPFSWLCSQISSHLWGPIFIWDAPFLKRIRVRERSFGAHLLYLCILKRGRAASLCVIFIKYHARPLITHLLQIPQFLLKRAILRIFVQRLTLEMNENEERWPNPWSRPKKTLWGQNLSLVPARAAFSFKGCKMRRMGVSSFITNNSIREATTERSRFSLMLLLVNKSHRLSYRLQYEGIDDPLKGSLSPNM